jgi:hypothetical protein
LPSCDITHDIHFEKQFVEGGSASFFGSHMEVGYNGCSDEYEWWYYCDKLKELVKVPAAECADACKGEDNFQYCSILLSVLLDLSIHTLVASKLLLHTTFVITTVITIISFMQNVVIL